MILDKFLKLKVLLKFKGYHLLQWFILLIVLSYFVIPYFPKYSIQLFGKYFFLSQILMLVGIILIPIISVFCHKLRERLRSLLHLHTIIRPLVLSMAIVTISTVLDQGLTQSLLSRLFSILAILIITFFLALLTLKFVDYFLVLSAWFTIAASVLGYAQYFGGAVFSPAWYLSGRGEAYAVGFAKYSSLFGLHLSVFLMVFWLLFIFKYKERTRLWVSTFLVGVPALVLTFSRGAWLATVTIGALTLVWLLREHPEKAKTIGRSLSVAALIAIITLAIGIIFSPVHKSDMPSGISRVNSIELIKRRLTITDDSSVSRLDFHVATFELMRDNPKVLLTGLGMDGFRNHWPEFNPDSKSQVRTNPHSTFLEILTAGGIFTFILFFIFLWRLVKTMFVNRNQSILYASFLVALLTVLVNGLTHSHLYDKYMWIIVGINLALLAILRENPNGAGMVTLHKKKLRI